MDSQQLQLKASPRIVVAGMATIDYLYVLDSHPLEDTENPVRRHSVVVGGPAGRGAIAAARLGMGNVQLSAMCGVGVHAEVLRQQLAEEPIDTTFHETEQPSQHSSVILAADTGSRTTIWTAQPRADAAMLASLPGLFVGADVVLLDCTDPVLSKSAISTCRALGIPTVIDTGGYKESSEEFLADVDYIVSPEKFFTRRHPDLDLQSSMAKAFADFQPKALVSTRGAAGGVYLDGRGTAEYDALAVDPVDTCGAGDTFHGAFAWAVGAGADIEWTLRIAAWSAGRKCAVFGNDGIPGRAELTEWLNAGNVRVGEP
ncbi:PfkB family carbohydrate kinase [Nocardia cyriacigeorgica]|uniref:PfkB family carbohydrate kinase n=1 Tax=Nocardia cyriacigeorgica TaxID=135487 RepID=UPI00189505AA|nr:PfkB family carbohydrate kinase [Nocardia cyriacigeorgica]MBF6452334.1 hypothetical protein [Nocardia cyriacigeorgica]MBF6478344.1 hypothetical protein [Nocardia cyriacigeorgica]MBF6549503.1 hypothetical protein [Nocardia cyriacigeorgica]